MDIKRLIGKVFLSPKDKIEYGTIRMVDTANYPKGFPKKSLSAIAEDDCGNLFAINHEDQVYFWDHETEEITFLSSSFKEFCKNCSEPKEIAIEDGKVISVWVDPNFKPEFD